LSEPRPYTGCSVSKEERLIHNEDNSHQIHSQETIKNANKTYFMLQNFFKNRNLSKKLKLILKNTTIDKTSTYASETWTLTKRERESN
jgi:hypothetical protein